MIDPKASIEILDKIEQIGIIAKKQDVLRGKLTFAIKYQEGLWKKSEFWLAGIPKRKLQPQLDEYITDYRKAFGHEPKWIQDTGRLPLRASAIDLDSFYGQMKIQWKKNREKKNVNKTG